MSNIDQVTETNENENATEHCHSTTTYSFQAQLSSINETNIRKSKHLMFMCTYSTFISLTQTKYHHYWRNELSSLMNSWQKSKKRQHLVIITTTRATTTTTAKAQAAIITAIRKIKLNKKNPKMWTLISLKWVRIHRATLALAHWWRENK